jgi:hypothetical protein
MSYTDLIDISNGDKEAAESFKYENDIVLDVKFFETKPAKSVVIIKFQDDDEFYDLFDMNDGDKSYINGINSYYGIDFVDSYWLDEEWDEGYLVQQITNQDLIKQIIKNMDPAFDFTKNDEDMYKKISSMLNTLNERAVDDIKDTFRDIMDRNANIEAKKQIDDDFCNVFSDIRFMEKECGEHKYYTTVTNLIRLYELSDLKDLDLYELIKFYAEQKDLGGNYYEYMYDLMWENFDNHVFNDSIQGELKKLFESSEEYYDVSPNPKELIKMIDVVNKMGGFNKSIDLRPNKEHKIMFFNVDNQTNTLKFAITKKGSTWETEKRSVDNLEDLNNAIYQPELFENRNKRNKLIMEQITSAEIANEFYNENKNLFNGKATPISHLTDALNKFNQNPKRPKLNLDKLMELSKTKNPLFKFDFYFLQNGKMEEPLTTATLQVGKDDKFVLTRVPGNNFIPGVKVNF